MGRSGGPGSLSDGEGAPQAWYHLDSQEREILRRVALESIRSGLSCGRPVAIAPVDFPPRLGEPGAVFVTLELHGRLRGCVGSCLATRPLVEDVALNAYGAAFNDPRFPPLGEEELQDLDYHMSLLTPLEPFEAEGRSALLAALRPGVDGLLLEDPPHRATFLPQVWDALPTPEAFLEELLLKAGLPPRHWSPTLRFNRYTVVRF